MRTEEAVSRSGRPLEIDRNALLDAAEKLFADHGFEGTTVRELAREAGCNPALFCYHFGGKEGLYQEVLLRHFQSMKHRMDRKGPTEAELARDWPKLQGPAQREFCSFLHGIASSMMSAPRIQKIIYRELMSGGSRMSSAISKSESSAYRLISERLEGLKSRKELLEECDTRLATLTLLGAFVYSMIASPMIRKSFGIDPREDEELRRLCEHQTRALFRGFGAR